MFWIYMQTCLHIYMSSCIWQTPTFAANGSVTCWQTLSLDTKRRRFQKTGPTATYKAILHDHSLSIWSLEYHGLSIDSALTLHPWCNIHMQTWKLEKFSCSISYDVVNISFSRFSLCAETFYGNDTVQISYTYQLKEKKKVMPHPNIFLGDRATPLNKLEKPCAFVLSTEKAKEALWFCSRWLGLLLIPFWRKPSVLVTL